MGLRAVGHGGVGMWGNSPLSSTLLDETYDVEEEALVQKAHDPRFVGIGGQACIKLVHIGKDGEHRNHA